MHSDNIFKFLRISLKMATHDWRLNKLNFEEI